MQDAMNKYVKAKLDNIWEEFTGFRESLNFINSKFEEFKSENAKLNNSSQLILKENDTLRSKLDILNHRINVMEQQARSCNLEIKMKTRK